MGHTKFEDHIKKTLKETEIKPSEAAWHKIKGQIGQDTKPKKTRYFRLGIAAGFIGVLLLSVLYYTADDAELNQDVQIVPRSSTSVADIEKEQLIKVPPAEEENAMIEVKDSFRADDEESAGVAKKEPKKKKVIVEDALLVNAGGNEDEAPEDPNALVDTKKAEVITIVLAHEENNEGLTEIEVDALLGMAQEEILTEKRNNSDNSVNPAALLAQVEEELDQSFRDKILQKLKSGYNKVRTAVADRNN